MHGEIAEVVVFPPNRGGAVVEHCRKYNVGIASGVAVFLGVVLGLAEIAPASLWLLQASWRLLWRVPSSRRGVAMFRGSCRPGSCPGQGQGCFRGPCPCHSRIPRRGKYKRSTGSWQHSGWSSAEHVSHSIAGSQSDATASRMAEQ